MMHLKIIDKIKGITMKKWIGSFVFMFVSAILIFPQHVRSSELTASEIMQKVKDRDDGDNQTADLEMILIDKSGDKRVRKISAFTKDKGKDTYRLLIFTHPANLKNTAFLTFDYYNDNKDDDQWLYLPALHKTKHIASTNKSGSFMGSDLNYSDMTSIDIGDYDFKFYKNREMVVRGKKVWVIEATPQSKDIIDETGYTKSLFLVREDIFYLVRAIRWEKNEEYIKYIDINELEPINGIWVGKKIYVNRKKNNETVHETLLTLKNIKLDQDLNIEMFSPHKLDKGF